MNWKAQGLNRGQFPLERCVCCPCLGLRFGADLFCFLRRENEANRESDANDIDQKSESVDFVNNLRGLGPRYLWLIFIVERSTIVYGFQLLIFILQYFHFKGGMGWSQLMFQKKNISNGFTSKMSSPFTPASF